MRTAMRCSMLVLLLTTGAFAGDGIAKPPAVPNAQEQIVWQECVTHRCRLVPEVRQIKKTVYEVQEVPYCLKKLPPLWSLFHHRRCDECGECAECCEPRYKKVLVKREVVCEEVCGRKCVVEQVVERVPCRVCVPGEVR